MFSQLQLEYIDKLTGGQQVWLAAGLIQLY